MLGDQPAALYGQGCTTPGHGRADAGHGRVPVAERRGRTRREPPAGVLATAAWEKAGAGADLRAGGVLRERRQRAGPAPRPGACARRQRPAAPDWARPHPLVVPAPAGLGTPHWHGADRITVLGASSTTTAADLAAASLAGVAHQIADALEASTRAAPRTSCGSAAGLSAHDGLLQAVADLSGLALEVAADAEATARGVAALAARGCRAAGGAAGTRRHRPAGSTRASTTGGRARERSRWAEALEVHVRTGRRERRSPQPGSAGGGGGPVRAGAAGRPRHRRRDHRRRHRARRGVPRPVGRADRGGRPGGGNLQPVEQADPRRPALPRDAGVRARARGAARAAPAADSAGAPPRAAGRVPVPAHAPGVGAARTWAPDCCSTTLWARPASAPGPPSLARRRAGGGARAAARLAGRRGAVPRRAGGRRPLRRLRGPHGRCPRRVDRDEGRGPWASSATRRAASSGSGPGTGWPGAASTSAPGTRSPPSASPPTGCSSWPPVARRARCGPRKACT